MARIKYEPFIVEMDSCVVRFAKFTMSLVSTANLQELLMSLCFIRDQSKRIQTIDYIYIDDGDFGVAG